MPTELVVGCPVRRRRWIIDKWFDHVEHACRLAGVVPTYAFVADPDDETAQQLAVMTLAKGRQCYFAWTKEPAGEDERTWDGDRFRRMVELRNQLLGLVRELAPQHFLSLDSDILLHPQTIKEMLDGIGAFGALGGATFMTRTGTQFPSCGWYRGMEGLVRRPMESVGVVAVGVIMAIKLMSPAAYVVDYEFNASGEDIGWSLACASAGVRLGWDNRHYSKHIMQPSLLGRIDDRCGW